MNAPRLARWTPGLILAVLLCALPAVASTDAYDFEIVLFERPGGGAEQLGAEPPDEPDRALATGRLDAMALPASAKSLGPAVYTLKKRGMIVHKHIAWRQTPARRDSRSWLWLDSGRLRGLLRVTRGRYLHIDTDLLLRDADSSAPYRIALNRRMRSGELHYLDHPKLGILIQAERYRAPVAAEAPDSATGEPRPAQPIVTPKPR